MDTAKAALVSISCMLAMMAAVMAAQPALPTSMYGGVSYPDGSPVMGVIVRATWQDNDGKTRTSSATTLTADEAKELGDASLAGHYFFNAGYVLAQEKSRIIITAQGAVNAEIAQANPGGNLVLVSGILLPDYSDTTPPQISRVEVLQLDTIAVRFTTNELAKSAVRYGVGKPLETAANSTISAVHVVRLYNLRPYSKYVFEVIATDISGNSIADDNNGRYYTFETGDVFYLSGSGNAPVQQGALNVSGELEGEVRGGGNTGLSTLPTSIYGRLTDENGKPLGDAEVAARYSEEGEERELKAVTLNEEDAKKLGDPSLVGYYFFRQNLTLQPETDVNVTSEAVKGYYGVAKANPGGSSRVMLVVETRLSARQGNVEEKEAVSGERRVEVVRVEAEKGRHGFPESAKKLPLILLAVGMVMLSGLSFRRFLARPRLSRMEKQLEGAIARVVGKKAKSASSSEVVSVDAEDTLRYATGLMLEREVGGMVVTRKGKPLGWVTEMSVAEDVLLGNRTMDSRINEATILPLTVVESDATLREAHAALQKSKVGKALVHGKDGLSGVITMTDIARQLQKFSEEHSINEDELPQVMMIMEKDMVNLQKKETLKRALQQMVGQGKDYALVEDGKEGILTVRDIVGELAINAKKAPDLAVSFTAKTSLKGIEQYATVFQANDVMLESFRRLPVMQGGKLVGVAMREKVVGTIMAYLHDVSKELQKRGKESFSS